MTEIEPLLRKVMPKIIADKELLYITETRKLPLDTFLHVGSDCAFFYAESRKLGITLKEARLLKEYFETIDPRKEIKYLKKLFPFVELEKGKE